MTLQGGRLQIKSEGSTRKFVERLNTAHSVVAKHASAISVCCMSRNAACFSSSAMETKAAWS